MSYRMTETGFEKIREYMVAVKHNCGVELSIYEFPIYENAGETVMFHHKGESVTLRRGEDYTELMLYDISIDEIYAMPEREAAQMAIEKMDIKGHQCYIVDFGVQNYFGYSVLVYYNGHHIYYVDDFHCHHSSCSRKELRLMYEHMCNMKLFTDEELMEKCETYDEYERKDYFLRNYRIMRYDYKSCFGDKDKKGYPFMCPCSFAYVKSKSIVEEQMNLHLHLTREYVRLSNDNDTFREMVRTQLFNHEAGLTGHYAEALDALGFKFSELTDAQRTIVLEELRYVIQHTE